MAVRIGAQHMVRCHQELVPEILRRLTPELASAASLLVTMGCGEACPYVPGLRRKDWALDDPKGRPPDEVRRIRDDIRARVERLVSEHGWLPRTS